MTKRRVPNPVAMLNWFDQLIALKLEYVNIHSDLSRYLTYSAFSASGEAS
jgi:hypothetical protein